MIADIRKGYMLESNKEQLYKTEIADSELGIHLEHLEGGRKLFSMEIGNMKIEVLDIPATAKTPYGTRRVNINETEKDRIRYARESYTQMWGGKTGESMDVLEDVFDGWDIDSPYTTTHQIATITINDGNQHPTPKILTHRRVAVDPEYKGSEVLLPDDITFWKAEDTEGRDGPIELASLLAARFGEDFVGKVAAISRTGVFPNSPVGVKDKSIYGPDTTSAAWGLIQFAVAYESTYSHFACQLCAELRDKIMTVQDGEAVQKLHFPKTEHTLGLLERFRLEVDLDNPELRSVMLGYPGYWLESSSFRELINSLILEGKLNEAHFKNASRDLLRSPEAQLLAQRDTTGEQTSLLSQSAMGYELDKDELQKVLGIFTTPRYFKYLVPLIFTKGEISEGFSGEEFRRLILENVPARPFSSLISVDEWRESARELLKAAKVKYER